MNLLLDQGLPFGAAALLRQIGWDVLHTQEMGLAAADDRVILERARLEGRIVVTLDADFHRLLAVANALAPSVIRLRVQGLDATATAALIQQVVGVHQSELIQGAAISVTPHQTRIRILPLI